MQQHSCSILLFLSLSLQIVEDDSLEDERQPVDDVEDEEEDGEGDEEELVDPPVLLGQLLHGDGGGGGALLDLVLEVVLADDLDVHAVGGGDVPLLLEQDRRVPATWRNQKEGGGEVLMWEL